MTNPLSGQEDEWYQIAWNVDSHDGSKLSALIDERNELKRDVERLKAMITEYALQLSNG